MPTRSFAGRPTVLLILRTELQYDSTEFAAQILSITHEKFAIDIPILGQRTANAFSNSLKKV